MISSLLVVALSGSVGAATDAAYFGTWKFDPSKSDLGPIEMTVTKTGDEYQLTDHERKSYTFKTDGKTYPDPYGASVTWREVSANEWGVTYAMSGKQVGIERYVMSPDGKSLEMKGTLQTGKGPVEQSTTFHRAGGGSGLVGRWSGGKLQLSPFMLEIVPNGEDGLIFRIPGVFESRAKFDGKPYPLTGPVTQQKSTATFTRVDARSFKMTQVDPSGTLSATVTVSADGKTLTEAGQTQSGTKRTWVFGRQ
jgi:hypothetical protein